FASKKLLVLSLGERGKTVTLRSCLMNRCYVRLALSIVVVVAVSNLLSCMHERKLVSIVVHPADTTFPTPDPTVQVVFTALGNYIHPPDTRDITDKVTWKTDVPQLLQVNGGVVSPQKPGPVCGIADISASVQDGGNLVIAYATVTVNDPSNPLCPGGNNSQAVVTVFLGGTGGGVVTSVPAGINCPSQSC